MTSQYSQKKDNITTKEKLIMLASKPITYTELRSQLGISDPVLQKHLADLREAGLLAKNEEGKYILTENGKMELLPIKSRQESGIMSPLIEKESDLEVITNAKITLALRKVLIFLFDSRYLKRNFPEKFNVKLSELEEHSETIKRLLVERYDPQFDLTKEEEDQEKYLRWRQTGSQFSQTSQWMYKYWFSRMENLVGLVETLQPGDVRDELAQALLAVSKVARGLGLETGKLEYRLSELLTP